MVGGNENVKEMLILYSYTKCNCNYNYFIQEQKKTYNEEKRDKETVIMIETNSHFFPIPPSQKQKYNLEPRKVLPILKTDEPVCPEGKLSCGNGECVEKELFCNGKPDCKDESDENACSKYIN